MKVDNSLPGRRAKFYSLTKKGKEQLQVKLEDWERTALVSRFLE